MVLSSRSGAGARSGNRLFEWIMAVTMILIAATLALPGDSLDRGAIRTLLETGLSEAAVGVVFAAIGVGRCVALFANRHLPIYGPLLRYIGSVVGAFFWSYLMSVLLYDSAVTGKHSMFMPMLGAMAAGEIVSVKRAVRDGRFRLSR